MMPVDTELGRLVDVIRGITFPSAAKRKAAAPGLVGCLRTTNVQKTVEWDDLLFVDEGYVKRKDQFVRVGDILVSMSNSLDLVGKCALVTHVPERAVFGAFIAAVRARPGVDPLYVYYAMRSPTFRAYVRKAASTTTNISNINASKLAVAPVPLNGPSTCKAIASKIDELFSRIDEGERALARVRKLLERYRQSVLKAAVTGELTRDWREQHRRDLDRPVESGAALLERILAARRAAWEQSELAKMQAKGKPPKTDAWKQKYKPPTPPDTINLPDLPQGWVWASLDMIADITGGITVDAKRDTTGCEMVPYLRVANVQRGRLALDEMKSILAPRERIEALALKVGDILFNEGGDIDKLGRGWVWEEQLLIRQ